MVSSTHKLVVFCVFSYKCKYVLTSHYAIVTNHWNIKGDVIKSHLQWGKYQSILNRRCNDLSINCTILATVTVRNHLKGFPSGWRWLLSKISLGESHILILVYMATVCNLVDLVNLNILISTNFVHTLDLELKCNNLSVCRFITLYSCHIYCAVLTVHQCKNCAAWKIKKKLHMYSIYRSNALLSEILPPS